MTESEERVAAALAWIVAALKRHAVPHQLVGGLAARAYGATRAVVDIDFYVPLDQAASLLAELRPYLIWGPAHFVDAAWDITFLKLDYLGQRVEFGDSSSRPGFFNRREGRWQVQHIDYSRGQLMDVFGVEVPVMPRDELIRYKRDLGRDVDLRDVQEMLAWQPVED